MDTIPVTAFRVPRMADRDELRVARLFPDGVPLTTEAMLALRHEFVDLTAMVRRTLDGEELAEYNREANEVYNQFCRSMAELDARALRNAGGQA